MRSIDTEQVPAAAPDFTGVWWPATLAADIGAGTFPPTTAWARETMALYDPLKDPTLRCVSPGFPRSGLIVYPFEIVQTDNLILFLYENFNMVRRIHMDGHDHPDSFPLSKMGHSFGRWEGDALVIETAKLSPGIIGSGGIQHTGESTRLIERYRRVNDGAALSLELTVVAPETFLEPWTRQLTWEYLPDGIIYESGCDPQDRRF